MSAPSPCPDEPTPWRWECHKCRTWYSISCTRRCLECSHVFCPKKYHSTQHSRDTRSSVRLRRQARMRRKNRRQSGGHCEAEFDYDGWAVWGSWRRMQLLRRRKSSSRKGTAGSPRRVEMEQDAFVTWEPETCYTESWSPCPPEQRAEVEKRKKEMYLGGRHDCSVHCDWPNECGHVIYAAKQTETVWGLKASGRPPETEKEIEFRPFGDGGEFQIFEDDGNVSLAKVLSGSQRATTVSTKAS